MDADGDFVVAWISYDQDGDGWGVFAQRYSVAGSQLGAEFQVNSTTTGRQFSPAVGMDEDGDFIITWESDQNSSSENDIYARRYHSDGTPIGSEFRVNSHTSSSQFRPAISVEKDGDFIITWVSVDQDGSGFGIYAQRYDSLGTPQGGEFQVNTWTTGQQYFPSVGTDDSGNFVISWMSNLQDGDSQGIYAQRYDSSGQPQGQEFPVNSYTTGAQSFASVRVDADGDFVVAWQSDGQDGSGYGIYARRFNAIGEPQANEFQVNSSTEGAQRDVGISIDAAGNFVITWKSALLADREILAKQFDASG
ncbi:MAG: hypothetical protein KDA36_06040, partial [Planctomycetaceae bacterium]|nr:hypothetical protein [Planctomycetaceae bacterium]